MDYDALKFWFQVGQAMLTAVIAIYVWQDRRHRATAQQVSEVKADVARVEMVGATRANKVEARVDVLEEALTHVPTHDDLTEIHETLRSMHGAIERTIGVVESMRSQLSLINQHLLERARG